MILIIGAQDEVHSKYIYDKLIAIGEPVEYFDTRKIPNNLLINWEPSVNNFIKGYFEINNKKICFSDIKSVYWRNHYGYSQPLASKDYHLNYLLEREIRSAYDSLFASSDWLWCNSIRAIEMHRKKTHQLNVMGNNNIRVPKTLITNDKDSIFDFWEKNNRNVIFKPVLGGAYTEQLKEEHLNNDNIDSLTNSPVQFQEMVKGVDVRVYVIGDKIFPAVIKAKTLDFRDDKEAVISPINLPTDVEQDCLKIMKLLDLNYSGIDIRLSETGEYVFIEANPAPMFIHFERQSGYPISETLVKMLQR